MFFISLCPDTDCYDKQNRNFYENRLVLSILKITAFDWQFSFADTHLEN